MDDVAIKVDGVSKDFILPHKKRGSLKSFFLSPFSKYERVKQHALDNVSFDVKKGEFFGIVGRNGSGKSTLLKCLAGVYTPNKGSIEVNGSLVPFIELGVGFDPELSGRDNVYLNGSLLGFTRKEIDQMYKEIVDFAELEKFMDQKLKNYSSGMQVRLAFSVAIQAKSDILLLDEVLAVGDSAFQQKCFNYFEKLKQDKQTIVFVTHDMNAVKRFCDTALLLEEGELRKIGGVNDIASQYLLDNSRENIAQERREETKREKSRVISKLDLKIINKKDKYQPDNSIEFEVTYNLLKKRNIYLGFSISKNGQSISEMNTRQLEIPSEKGQHKLTCNISGVPFLQGIHEVGIAAFDTETTDMLDFKNRSEIIYINSEDERYGGLIKLSAEWNIKK